MFRKPGKRAKSAEKTQVTDIASCQKSLRLHVGMDVVAPVREAVVKEVQREAHLPGFRKGRVPVEVIERQFARSIREQTVKRVTEETLHKAIKEHSLKPVGPFELSRTELNEGEGLSLEATVEVEPEFHLADYHSLAVTRPSAEVTAQDVEQGLERLRESTAQMVPGKEGEPKKREVPELSDELAKDLGFNSVASLREHVEAKLREQKRAEQERIVESALCEELLKRHSIELPAQLVTRKAESLTHDLKARLQLSGMSEDKVSEEAAKFTDQLRTNAERHVKLEFIFERIADKESVKVTQDELLKQLWTLSRRWNKDPAEVRKLLDDQQLWPSVVSTIRREKTMALIKAAAAIENGKEA